MSEPDPDGKSSHYSLGRDRARLISDRLTEVFQVRMKCERARTLDGQIPDKHQLAMHNAVRDVYLALRPLREEDAIADWWDDVVLSQRWGEWQRVDGDHDEAVPIGTTDDGDVVYGIWVPYTGLDVLDDVRDIVEEQEVEKRVFGGVKHETVAEPNPLPYDILLDVSATLEDAARKLGFMPETRDSTPRTDIPRDMIEEVKAWAEQNT